MILVTGATGQLGKAAIHFLLQRKLAAANIIALVRDEQKAADLKALGVQVRIGDYTDRSSLDKAFTGVEKLLLVSSSDVAGDRLVQHKNAIDAAIAQGVKHILYTGIDIRSYSETVIPHVALIHRDTADYLRSTGVAYTVLNDGLYADLVPLFAGPQVLETGIFFPAGEGKTPFALRSEMAEAAANILTSAGHENKEYAITASSAYSFGEIAEILSSITGRKVPYLNPDKDTYIAGLVKAGVPEGDARFFAGFGVAIADGEFDTHRSDLGLLLGRKPTDLQDFLRTVYGAKD